MGLFKDALDARKKRREMRGRSESDDAAVPIDVVPPTPASLDAMKAIVELADDQKRLWEVGIQGEATITAVHQDVGEIAGMPWHDIVMMVEVPGRDAYGATQRIAIDLGFLPGLKVGARVHVRVDAHDASKVLISPS